MTAVVLHYQLRTAATYQVLPSLDNRHDNQVILMFIKGIQLIAIRYNYTIMCPLRLNQANKLCDVYAKI